MKSHRLESGEGIVLSVRKAGEGGRSVRLFTRGEGRRTFFASRGTLRQYGPGLLQTFARIRYSAVPASGRSILTQYEGTLSFDLSRLAYEDLARWYCTVELAEAFFPEGQADGQAFALLAAAAEEGARRNPTVLPCILAVQLLAAAGSDPAEEEPMESLDLSAEGQALVKVFRRWPWQGEFPIPLRRSALLDAARYLDAFILRYGDVELKTAGAFSAGL